MKKLEGNWYVLQWGSENRPFDIRIHSKTEHFGGQVSNAFENRTKMSGFQLVP